jgi:putative ABC transport system permease protein
MSLALRNLIQDKTRFALSVLGVALAVMLIIFLLAFSAGIYRRAAAYLDNAPGAVVVAPKGVRSMAATSSLLPPGTADTVAKVEGVGQVTPVLVLVAIPDLHGRKETLAVIGYDPTLGAGPWALARGREPRSDDEVVVDRVLARRHGIKIADTMVLSGKTFTVVGLSDQSSSWSSSYVFARKSAVESIILAPGSASILLITPAAGTPPEVLRDRLQRLPGAGALLKRDMIANDRKLLAKIYDPPILLMLGTAFVVGALVVGLVIYTATIERQREYGVLKAVGARNTTLYRVVTAQALIAAGVGAVLGIGLAAGLAQLIMALRPQFLIVIEPGAVGRALAAGSVMALLGALLPARAVARLAPADVFRR